MEHDTKNIEKADITIMSNVNFEKGKPIEKNKNK